MAAPPPNVVIVDEAIKEPAALASAVRPHLGPHPVPQSDPRTRGFIAEIPGGPDTLSRLRAQYPAFSGLIALLRPDPTQTYLLAVNETPPTSTDSFLLRPHVDRRWSTRGFSDEPPHTTTVLFLHFPSDGSGGELVVFPRGAFQSSAPLSRDNARRAVADAGGLLVTPRPGRSCRFAGDLPHAVLGYTAPEGSPWRLAVVLAEFPQLPAKSPPRSGWGYQ